MPKPSSPYPHSDRELIRLIERSPSHRAGYKQLIRELGLGGGRERRLLLEQLARITLRGELVKLDTGFWALPHATPEMTARQTPGASPYASSSREVGSITRDKLIAGKLDLHRDGFGFVRPNGSSSREDDLFIPPNELNGAMQGDEALVDEAPPGRDGRRSGRILRILTRRNPTVVGIFHYAKPAGRSHSLPSFGDAGRPASSLTSRFNFVTPLDERMTQPILIPDGPDGQVILPPTSTEHRVLGEEANRTYKQQTTNNEQLSLEGLAVDIEITDFPSVSKSSATPTTSASM
jgi:ribonuclease R